MIEPKEYERSSKPSYGLYVLNHTVVKKSRRIKMEKRVSFTRVSRDAQNRRKGYHLRNRGTHVWKIFKQLQKCKKVNNPITGLNRP